MKITRRRPPHHHDHDHHHPCDQPDRPGRVRRRITMTMIPSNLLLLLLPLLLLFLIEPCSSSSPSLDSGSSRGSDRGSDGSSGGSIRGSGRGRSSDGSAIGSSGVSGRSSTIGSGGSGRGSAIGSGGIGRGSAIGSGGSSECSSLSHVESNSHLPIYWINLDSSTSRRVFMEEHFTFYHLSHHHRLAALVLQQVIVKERVYRDHENCLHLTAEDLARHGSSGSGSGSGSGGGSSSQLPNTTTSTTTSTTRAALPSSTSSLSYIASSNESILLESLCGRPKNEIREVVVTLSHLNAIRRAMATHPPPPPITTTSSTTSSTTTSSSVDLADYALIMEDDFYFAYEVNFHALISLAPPDFVVLQLVTSNDYSVLNLWRVFERRKRLFVRRKDHDDYWCAGGYLIHIERLRQIVDGVLYRAAGGGGDHQQQFHAKNGHFLASPLRQGCILSPRGYTADHVIFTLSKETYMLTVPILLNAPHGNMSTVHSEHVTFHQPAFHRMRQLTDKMAHELPSSHPALYAMLRQ
eukprot:scaffold1898_cov169-Ochromonas_danica.AAC.1